MKRIDLILIVIYTNIKIKIINLENMKALLIKKVKNAMVLVDILIINLIIFMKDNFIMIKDRVMADK